MNGAGGHRERIIFSTLAVAVLAWGMVLTMIVPVLPRLQVELHTSPVGVSWVMTAYLLSAAICTPLVGRWGDATNKRTAAVAVLVVFCLGSVLAALAHTLAAMIVARALQGVAGGILPLSFGIIRDTCAPSKIVRSVASLSSLSAGGGALGLSLAGPITNSLGYRWLFWLPTIPIVAACAAALVVIPNLRGTGGRQVGWLAAIPFAGWLTALLLVLSYGGHWGWGSATTLGLVAGIVPGVALWILVERSSQVPLIDLALMSSRAVWTTNLVTLLVGVSLYGGLQLIPQFIEADPSNGYGFGASVTAASLIMIPLTALMFVAGQFCHPLGRRFGMRATVVAGAVVAAAGIFLLALAHDATWEITAISAVLGLGFGLVLSTVATLIVNAVQPAQTSFAAGANTNMRTIGGSIGSALVGSILASFVFPSGVPREQAYVIGFVLIGAVLLLAACIACVIPAAAQRSADASDAIALPATGLVSSDGIR